MIQECPKVRRKVVVLESCDADNLIRNEIQLQLFHRYNLAIPTVKAWNDLPLPTHNLESLNSFKSLINTKNTKVPAHYYVGCRLGKILHARLLMNCSALNAHLFIRNLVESPNCTVEGRKYSE
jgi:hypothetical protein